MPSSCLCFCKASALKGNPGWLFLVGFWLACLSFWLLVAFGWLSGWFGLAPGWLSGWLSGWFGLASGWLSGWFGLASGWLSGWFGLAFWLVWFGSWLAFWLVWFGSWLAFWLVWLGFLFFPCVFLARLAETQLLGILQAYLGVIILQPHACAQRFRLRILRRTRSNAGRTSARSLSGRIESIWETPSKERGAARSLPTMGSPVSHEELENSNYGTESEVEKE